MTTGTAKTPIDAPFWPDHLVIGLFNDRANAFGAKAALVREGFDKSQVFVFRGPQAARRLDAGYSGDFIRRALRVLWLWVSIEAIRMRELATLGRSAYPYAVVVQAETDERADYASHVLAGHGSHETTRFSRGQGVEVRAAEAAR